MDTRIRAILFGVAAISVFAFAGGVSRADEAAEAMARGMREFQKKNLDGAIECYSEAIRLDPESAAAYGGRGYFYLLKDDYDKAIDDCTEAVRLNSNYPDAYTNRAHAYVRKGERDKAVDDCTESIAIYANLLQWQYRVAHQHFRRFSFGPFLSLMFEIAGYHLHCAEAYNTRGMIYAEQGEMDKAIADFDDSLRLAPAFSKTYHFRGYAHAVKGDHDKALADYTEALRLNPKDAEVYANRGYTLCRKGEMEKAFADFEKAVSLQPDNLAVYGLRSNIYYDQGEYEKAIADSRHIIRLKPEEAKGYNDLAWMQAVCPDAKYRNGKEAVENARKAVELEKGDSWAYLDTLAAAHAECGEFEKARELQEKVVETASEQKKEECRVRLELYKQGKPYHEEAKKK